MPRSATLLDLAALITQLDEFNPKFSNPFAFDSQNTRVEQPIMELARLAASAAIAVAILMPAMCDAIAAS